MAAKETNCYCAFCRIPRQVYTKRTLSLANYLQASGISLLGSYIFWREPDPKALIFFVLALVAIEAGILFRHRGSLVCPHCGFDPVVYRRDSALACARVKEHIKGRQEDPDVWLARKPPIRILGGRKKNKNSTRELVV